MKVLMKEHLISLLRDKNTDREEFRRVTHLLTHILLLEAAEHLEYDDISLETPLVQTTGKRMKGIPLLVPILRSGVALLPVFQKYFPSAQVGIVGLKRDEQTAQAAWYYHNIPLSWGSSYVFILDPMIATGGTALEVLKLFVEERGVAQESIIFVCCVAASEGMKVLRDRFGSVCYVIGVEDAYLNDDKFILPGLGDFGDRYFGTE